MKDIRNKKQLLVVEVSVAKMVNDANHEVVEMGKASTTTLGEGTRYFECQFCPASWRMPL